MVQTTVKVEKKTWKLLTDNDVSAVRVQNRGAYGVYIQATSTTAAPTSSDIGTHGEIWVQTLEGWTADRLLSELFPGVTNAKRLWAWSNYGADISVSYA